MNNKFNIGDKVKIRADLRTGEHYGIDSFEYQMKDMRGKVTEITKVERCYNGTKYQVAGGGIYSYTAEMFEDVTADKVIFNGNATVLIKDGKKYVSKCMDGDAYDKEKGLLLCLAQANGISYRDLQEMIAGAKDCNLEKAKEAAVKLGKATAAALAAIKKAFNGEKTGDKAQVREVKRPAKEGEYIKIIDATATGGCYKNGEIFKAIEVKASGGAYIKTKKTHPCCVEERNGKSYVYKEEYVVLENYKPYKITLSEFFNTKGKYAVRLRTVDDCKKFINASKKRGKFSYYEETHPIYSSARNGKYKCVGYGFVWEEGFSDESFYAKEGAIILNVDEVDLEN